MSSSTEQAAKRWLLERFRNRVADLQNVPDAEITDVDYFSAGYIDSFGIIELIEELESEFGVQLGDRELQDRRMASIQGLAEILAERVRDAGRV